ncbi:MAG: hypothetical protein KUG74_02690 [Rhodobacteraceae bacterium]|nr:hypothetical protein [Paracoccaceae bacterium]
MEQSVYGYVNDTTGTPIMMKEMLKIVRHSPHSVLEDVIGVSAIFTMVVVGLHLPLTF